MLRHEDALPFLAPVDKKKVGITNNGVIYVVCPNNKASFVHGVF